MTHTKGPWANVSGDDIHHGVEIEDSEGYCHTATEEDLSFMALAPEMLRLLEKVMHCYNCNYTMQAMMNDYGNQFKTILAKAKGKSI